MVSSEKIRIRPTGDRWTASKLFMHGESLQRIVATRKTREAAYSAVCLKTQMRIDHPELALLKSALTKSKRESVALRAQMDWLMRERKSLRAQAIHFPSQLKKLVEENRLLGLHLLKLRGY